MKKFFSDYGYSCVKIFVNQFAIALFGVSLVIAVSALDNEHSGWLVYLVSALSVLFYLILIYSIPWNHGAKDRISVDYQKKDKNLLLGLYMGLVANIPNVLVALQGMYLGLLQFKIGETSLNAYWWMLLVVMIPSIVTSSLAYIAGYNNVRVFKFKEQRKYY